MAVKNTSDVLKLKYTCPACPPEFVDMALIYDFGKDDKGYYFQNGDSKTYAELWFIKMLFSPVDKTWEETKE